MHTEAEKAYLAGLLDGEGHITIGLLNSPNGRKRHTLVVAITNTELGVLNRLCGMWPTSAVFTRARQRDRGWKISGDLKWTTESAAQMLREISPYLLMKAERASIALEFSALLRPREHRTKPISPKEFSARETLRIRMRELNRRGGTEPTQRVLFAVNLPLKCECCGKEFTTYQKRRKYCGQECQLAAGRDAYLERNSVQKICPTCSKPFMGRLIQRFCSVSCGSRHSRSRPKVA